MKSAPVAKLVFMGLTVAIAGLMATSGLVYGAGTESKQTWPVATTATPSTPVSFSIRGFNFPSWWHDEYMSPAADSALADLSATGANWVAIIPTQYMQSLQASVIGPDPGGGTATDAALAHAIDEAHARGLKVMLKPHIDIEDGSWRNYIAPADAGAWFDSYRTMMDDYAHLAQAHHVELMAIGTELGSMSGQPNYSQWQNVAAGVRSIYSGPLTYAAGTDESQTLSFWGLMDYVGLDVYLPTSDVAQPSLDELVAGWTNYNGSYGSNNWLALLEQWQAQWDKPVIFTEIGYRSIQYAARSPWDYSFPGVYDGDLQARAAEAALRVFNNRPWLAGMFWWDWMVGASNNGAGNTDFTVSGKPAEATLTAWYSGAAPNLTETVISVSWASYQDYMERRLSLGFDITNTGIGTTLRVRAEAVRASGGTWSDAFVPMDLGDLRAGGAANLTVVYRVPPGIFTFGTIVDLSCQDSSGAVHNYPASN